MKLIYLTNARIPTEKAHGLQIMKMVEAFKHQGIDADLVVAKRINKQLEQVDPFDYYNVKVKFTIKKLWLIDMVNIKLLPRKLSVFIQNTSFAISSFFYLLNKKVDLIYSRDEFSLFLLSFIKKNLVLELHTFPQGKLFIYKFLFKRVKKIIVITSHLKKLIEELGIDENKILVSPDGVDIEQFEISNSKTESRKKLNLPIDKKIILYSGHLFDWKGVYVLAEASKFLPKDSLIVFVGGMEYDKNKLKDFINKQGLKNILFIGHQSPKNIPYYLKAADVVVLPNSGQKTISVHYTSPIKMFEYMAAQRPIVASDLPSIREILNPANALLVAPDVASELADGIKKVLADDNLNEMMTSQAFQEVKKYTWHKRAENILNFIK